VLQRGVHDFGFACGQVRNITAGVVEEDREVIDVDLVEQADLGDDGRLVWPLKSAVQLAGTAPHTEAQSDASAMPRQVGQFGHGGVRVRLAPETLQVVHQRRGFVVVFLESRIGLQIFSARSEMLFTPNFFVAPWALSDRKRYSSLTCSATMRNPAASIACL
jgi:hypothetical protein